MCHEKLVRCKTIKRKKGLYDDEKKRRDDVIH